MALRRTIDAVADSCIRRIRDAVLNAMEGDARHKLISEQHRLRDQHKRSIATLLGVKKSLKAKHSLLRSTGKEAGGPVFAPLMLQTVLDTFGRS
jgi:hypothetical protein